MILAEEEEQKVARSAAVKTSEEKLKFLDDLFNLRIRQIKSVEGGETRVAVSYWRSITALVKHYPKEQEITQRQLAKRLGLTDVTLSYWQSGRRFPTFEHRVRILDETGIHIPPPPPHGKRQR